MMFVNCTGILYSSLVPKAYFGSRYFKTLHVERTNHDAMFVMTLLT